MHVSLDAISLDDAHARPNLTAQDYEITHFSEPKSIQVLNPTPALGLLLLGQSMLTLCLTGRLPHHLWYPGRQPPPLSCHDCPLLLQDQSRNSHRPAPYLATLELRCSE